MQSFDQHLTKLYKNEEISYDVAIGAASSPSNFERNLEFGGEDEPEEGAEENVSPINGSDEEEESGEPLSNELSLDVAK